MRSALVLFSFITMLAGALPVALPAASTGDILAAVQRHDLATVKSLIAADSTLLNVRDKGRNTLLHLAAGMNDTAMLRWLLERVDAGKARIGAMLPPPQLEPVESLMVARAIERTRSLREQEMIRAAYQMGADVAARNEKLNTPLHLASMMRDTAIMVLLLRHHADPNALNGHGQAPLHLVSHPNDTTSMRVLLDHGADPNIRGEHGATPLFDCGSDAMRLLIARGANVNSRDDDSSSPILSTALRRDWNGVRFLMDHGGDARVADRTGIGVLHVACRDQWGEFPAFLLDAGLDVNARDRDGRSPFFDACEHQNIRAAELLLSHGADALLQSADHHTMLHAAVVLRVPGAARVVGALLARGAGVNARTAQGVAPLHLALLAGKRAVIDTLLAHHADVRMNTMNGTTPLQIVAGNWGEFPLGNLSRPQNLYAEILSAPPDPVAEESTQGDGVGVAVAEMVPVDAEERGNPGSGEFPGRAWMIGVLLRLGAEVDARDSHQRTALHHAAIDGDGEACSAFIAGNAVVDARDRVGATPLMMATYDINRPAAETLLAHGASVNAVDTAGATPLHWAVRRHSPAIEKALLARGADPAARNHAGKSPIDLIEEPRSSAVMRSHVK